MYLLYLTQDRFPLLGELERRALAYRASYLHCYRSATVPISTLGSNYLSLAY
jgi:hypothetical protein